MLQVGFKTNKGMVRTHNEDACFIIPERNVYIVADGVGGNSGGEIASRTAIYEITQYVHEKELSEDAKPLEVRDYLAAALDRANLAIREKSDGKPAEQSMATTIVICCIRGKYAYFAHLGDSRAYIMRGEKMLQITQDHTYVNALVKAGMITEREALTHEKRHMITKALGTETELSPDYEQVEIMENDRILLCSDGLYGEVSEKDMARIAQDSSLSMGQVCERLVEMANEAGGEDNITVVCLRV